MTPRLKQYLSRTRIRVDKALRRFLPKKSAKPSVIHEAMRYSVFAGGKRLRPLLVLAAAEATGGSAPAVLPTACAFELIHTYSLIHDDLPAMDNGDLRRGRPTNHKIYGDDIAILAGDALLTHAFSLVEENSRRRSVSPRSILSVLKILTEGAGTFGMIGGQVADVQSDKGRWKSVKNGGSKDLLSFIHAKKTAALFRASLKSGALLSNASKRQIRALDRYGYHLGMAFQIYDDILDQIGDRKRIGKNGSDAANQKLTFPALYGLDHSEKSARGHIRKAIAALKPFGSKAAVLRDLAEYVVSRDR